MKRIILSQYESWEFARKKIRAWKKLIQGRLDIVVICSKWQVPKAEEEHKLASLHKTFIQYAAVAGIERMKGDDLGLLLYLTASDSMETENDG